MATIVDALLITLGLDTTGFKKGQKETEAGFKKTQDAANKTTKNLEAEGKKAAKFFKGMRNEVIALTAALLGANGIKSFVANITSTDAALGRMAKNVGMSVEELGAWQAMAARSGGSADGMSGTIRGLTMQMEKLALTGQSDLIPFLTAAHVNMSKFFNVATPMQEKLLMLADALHGMSPQKAQSLGQSMGMDEGTINMLMLGRDAVQKLRKEQESIGHTTSQDAKAAIELAAAWERLSQSARRLGETILTALSPFLKEVLDDMTGLANLLNKGNFGKITKAPAATVSKPNTTGWSAADRLIQGTWFEYFLHGSKTPTGSRKVSGQVINESSKANGLFAALEAKHGLPSGLLDRVWSAESGRGKNMRSPAGAQGHFQFMPGTASAYGLKDPNNLNESASAAAKLLSDLLKHYNGNLGQALAGYNWGMGNVDRKGMGALPKETRDYIAKITSGMSMSGGSGSRTYIHNGPIIVQTKATDAVGIAKSIGPAVQQTALATQANQGLN